MARAYPPKGDWPDSVDPLPMARMIMAGMQKTNGALAAALRSCLKGCLLGGHRRGPIWVSDLQELARILVDIGQQPQDSPVLEKGAVPERIHIRLVTSGYLQELCMAAMQTYGLDAAFTRAVLRWADALRRVPDQPPPDHPEFAKRFNESQVRLLEWAGMAKSKGIVLSGGDDVLRLSAGLESLSVSGPGR